MILLIPIYPGRQKALWCGDAGRSILASRVSAALDVRGVDQVLVVTDEPEALEGIVPSGDSRVCGIVREQPRHGEASRFLPTGTHAALEAVREMTGRVDVPVMVLDFRCPFVSGEDMASALREHAASGRSALITVTAVRDNPCQLERYYNIVDTGVLHLFESGERATSCLEEAGLLSWRPSPWAGGYVTRIFPFDWAAKGIAPVPPAGKKKALYFRTCITDRVVAYLPYEGGGGASSTDAPPCLWVHESERLARLVIPSVGAFWQQVPSQLPSGAALVGACVRGGETIIPYYLYMLTDGRYCLYTRNDMGGARLHLMPITCSDTTGNIDEAVDGIQNGGFINGVMKCGSFFLFDRIGKADAFCFWLLDDVGDQGSYDLRFDYPGEEVLWRTEESSGRKLTLTSGEHITGRQLFPDVYAPCSCVGILPACHYETYDSDLAKGTCTGWVLPAERALRIASEFDMLILKSMSEEYNCF